MRLQKLSTNKYLIPRSGAMQVDAVLYLNDDLFADFQDEESLRQLAEAASLPGLYGPVVGMPDIHAGYGLPIGGVMAMDAAEGLISAGAVGMDINCGVRLLRTELEAKKLTENHLRSLMKEIVSRVPTGIGKVSKHQQQLRGHFEDILEKGLVPLRKLGYVRDEDPFFIEESGSFPGASSEKISRKAYRRGNQLSTIGGGNHFIELGVVDRVYDRKNAPLFGLYKGMLSVLVHTGSRGLGHQICVDYSSVMNRAAGKYGLKLPSKGLAAVPISSKEGKDYLAAMAAAVNFAFANRQLITYDIRNAFSTVFRCPDTELGLETVYDLAHNIAKFEKVEEKLLLIHRKGATRALPPGHENNPGAYMDSGHPIVIPGSMATPSYVVTANPGAAHTFHSANHGAGRAMSRRAARSTITPEMLKNQLGPVLFHGNRLTKITDEAPQAYKNIHDVLDTLANIGIINKVARLSPLAVIKGEE